MTFHGKLASDLFEHLQRKYAGTGVEAEPHIPELFPKRDFAVDLWVTQDGKRERACGLSLQMSCCNDPFYKIVFYSHPEWVQETAQNPNRRSYGGIENGFFLETEKECIAESEAFLREKYPQAL